ncbi:hypothetical protein D3C79_49290 [compost metagenome]
MWTYLPVVLLPALLVVLVCRWIWPHHITIREWLLQGTGVILSTLIFMVVVWGSSFSMIGDTSIFNGYVTGKDRVKVSCSHHYVCGETCHMETTTDSKGKKHTRKVCQPKYCDEHSYDVDWDVYSTLGTFTIERVDRRGMEVPDRWDMVDVDEPVAVAGYVRNYMLLDGTRFNTSDLIRTKYLGKIPGYPHVHDYYRYNRIVQDPGDSTDFDGINIWLNNQLRKDGALKQLNVILVVTQYDQDYFYAVMEAWKGTKKNDVVIFYGVDDKLEVQWTKAMSFADGQNNQVMLKEVEGLAYDRTLDIGLVQDQYRVIQNDFKRVPNKTFAYLTNGWIPPTWLLVTLSILNFLVAVGVAYVVIKEDVA